MDGRCGGVFAGGGAVVSCTAGIRRRLRGFGTGRCFLLLFVTRFVGGGGIFLCFAGGFALG